MNSRTLTLAAMGLVLGLGSCVPWTVRPIGDAAKSPESVQPQADPAALVDSIWSSRLIPSVLDSAVDARVLLSALASSPEAARKRYGISPSGGGTFYVVRGEGVVIALDRRSRIGLALVDIAPFDRRPDVSIQIGPVLTGNALRDATGIVRFSDFVNQLQFADAGNEINSRALKSVLAPLDLSRLEGKTVSFAGALQAANPSEPPLAGLVPVLLKVKESR